MGIVTTSSVKIHVAGQVIDLEGGGGCVPGPDTVGTEQIKNGAVIEDDLHDDVKSGLHELENPENYADHGDVDNIFGENQASTAPTVPTQPITVEEEEEP